MPCNDITEVISLSVDENDCLQSYQLNKRTCGAEIGQAQLLVPFLKGKSADQITHMGTSDLAEAFAGVMLEDDEFLYFKHLLAVQESLRVLLGHERGAPGDLCTVANIGADEHGLHFEGLISIDAVTEKIKSCGGCGGCGSKKKARQLETSS